MKLGVIRVGLAAAIVWALITLFCGIANLILPEYGVSFLNFLDSIYPGYHFGKWGFGGILVATLYAAVDAFVVGAVFAWLYNLLGKCIKEEKK